MDIILILGGLAILVVGFVGGMATARYLRKRNDAELERLYDMSTSVAKSAERRIKDKLGEGLGGPGRPPASPPK
jgi:hypothetical protein